MLNVFTDEECVLGRGGYFGNTKGHRAEIPERTWDFLALS